MTMISFFLSFFYDQFVIILLLPSLLLFVIIFPIIDQCGDAEPCNTHAAILPAPLQVHQWHEGLLHWALPCLAAGSF